MKKKKVNAIVLIVFLGSLILSYVIGQKLTIYQAANEKEANIDTITSDFKLENALGIADNAPFEIIKKYKNPVLERGKSGEWDCADLLNPSVIEIGEKYYNYYSGFDGEKWSTGLAISEDGINWEKYKNNPVISLSDKGWDSKYIAANGAAVYFDNKIYYYYQGMNEEGVTQVGLAISENTVDFVKQENAVITCGEAGTWDSNGIADPYIIEHNGKLYMYYLGMNELNIQRLGVAVSEDGLNWTKSNANPIMDVGVKGSFDENGLGEPSVYYEAPYFYMLYTGRDVNEVRNLGLAYSLDGINWYKNNYNGLIEMENNVWDSKVICDTSFLYNNEEELLYVWYGGGDKAEPAENLNGNIGLFTVDISQGRDMYSWDAKFDWSKSKVSSTEALSGSFEIENGEAWVSDEIFIDLKNDMKSDTLCINGYMPFQNYIDAGIENVKMYVYINNKLVCERLFNEEGEFKIELSKSGELKSGRNLKVKIVTDAYIIPAALENSEDHRKLAWIIKDISQ